MGCLYDRIWFWIKPHCTTWFNEFVMYVYDDEYSIDNFCLLIAKHDTKYHNGILIEIRIYCVLYKLVYWINILSCRENFAISRSTIGLILQKFVKTLNIMSKQVISWPVREVMQQMMLDFWHFYGLSSVYGAINGTHIIISKSRFFLEDLLLL